MSTLMQASNQWANRPADERFSSLDALHAAAISYRDAAREAKSVPYSSLRVAADGNEVVLVGKANIPSKFTHWSFGQLAADVEFPASPLRSLPATLATQVLNHKLAKMTGDASANLLLHQNGGYHVRALTSEKYTRIWNCDVTSRLLRLTQEHPEWQPAPAAFDGSRGLYLGDRDMFAFLVDNERRIFERDQNGGLGRGFFVGNSEVGSSTFFIMTFFYEYVCGNHRVWGASGVKELRLRHRGAADQRAFASLQAELKVYADSSAADDEAKVVSMRSTMLGTDKGSVLDRVFGLKLQGVGRKLLTEAYELAEKRTDWYGDPNSVWGYTGGLTELARDMATADRRVEVDRAAGRIMQVAF